MNKIGSYNKLIISGVIFLLLIPIFSNTGFSTETNRDDSDGWWTDTFQNNTYIKKFENCEIPSESGKITLSRGIIDDEIHDFSDYGIHGHIAYWYRTPFFIEFMGSDLNIFKRMFTWREYDGIKQDKDKRSTTHDSSNGIIIVHLFRFNIENIKDITQLDLYWRGKAINDRKVSIYYWAPKYIDSLGKWIEVDKKTSNGAIIELQDSVENFDKESFNNSDYIDICVVVTPLNRMKICSISSDYVQLDVNIEGYYDDGNVISTAVTPRKISSWEMLTWQDKKEGGASIRYQILYANNESVIKDEILEGNENGFYKSPVYLTSLNVSEIDEIKIKAKLVRETGNILRSPEIHSWSVAWQTREKIWQDLFNSTLRVSESESVHLLEGNVSITAYNEWPMFGQNPENTRASDGYGVTSKPERPFWYSSDDLQIGGLYRNPVIKNEMLYIASSDGEDIYVFHEIFKEGYKEYSDVDTITIPDANLIIENSPAVTDNYVIVATGSQSAGGVENKVYAFNVDNLNKEWEFSYKDDKTGKREICYSASPTISNGKIFLSAWSGDKSVWDPLNSIFNLSSLTKGNNRLIMLSEENGKQIWEFPLPAGSFSNPAVCDAKERVIVGCQNVKGDSLFALDINSGEVKWKQTVGPIGRAAPVIYDNIVFVVVKKPVLGTVFSDGVEIIALDLNNGDKLWNFSVNFEVPKNFDLIGCSTPTVYNNILFVTFPNNKLYAINIVDGSEKWQKNLFVTPLSSTLISSPVSAEGLVYVGTQNWFNGVIYTFDEKGKNVWTYSDLEFKDCVSSPIIVDGLLFFSDEEGHLFSLGSPRSEQRKINGQLVSIKIRKPHHQGDNYLWDRFNASYYLNNSGTITFHILDEKGTIIKKDIESGEQIPKDVGSHNIIQLRADFTKQTSSDEAILYHWNLTIREDPNIPPPNFLEDSFIKTDKPLACSVNIEDSRTGLLQSSAKYTLVCILKNETYGRTYTIVANCTGSYGSKDVETLTANISNLEISKNITIDKLISIKFYIENLEHIGSDFFYEFEPVDTKKPVFYKDSFTPQWTKTNTPVCTIEVQDIDQDNFKASGLNISSAKYTLEYKDQSGTKTITGTAQCSGHEGSTKKETISVDISKLDFSENITELIQIRFYIEDLAKVTNSNYSKWHEFKNDAEKPSSNITNGADIEDQDPYNQSSVNIMAAAEDYPPPPEGSGVAYVTLYYRHSLTPNFSANSWTEWDSTNNPDDSPPWSWSFTAKRDEGGYYELCTIATDNASNEEDFPGEDEDNVSFIFDPNPPDAPSFDSEYRFDELPEFSIEFTDDYKLKSVEYRLNFNEANEWTKINDWDINSKSYAGNWNLTQDDWGYMIEEESYYMYFRLIDSLGNQYITPSASEAVKIIKDFDINETTPHDPNLSDFQEWHWDNVFTISVNITGEDITNLQLHYSYSADNITWNEWKQYGDNQTAPLFIWNFTAETGSGYYRFKTVAWDTNGNVNTSKVKLVSVTLFPTIPIIIMMSLAVILILVTAFVLGFKPFKLKKKKT